MAKHPRSSSWDLVVLGGGSAGMVSSVAAGQVGLRVLLIEKDKMGGECSNTGCVPSKALLHAADLAQAMRSASAAGLPAVSISRKDAAGVLPFVRQTVRTLAETGEVGDLLRESGVTIRFGSPQFVRRDALELNGETIRARHFIVATGSRPAVPDIPGLEDAGCLTNQTVFSLKEIPESLVVLGGGPVGVEMAQAFHRLGAKVTLVQQAPRLLPRDDLEIAQELERLLRAEGLAIHLSSRPVRVERRGRVRRVTIEGPEGVVTVEAREILAAVGRRPNVQGLNLKAAGVRVGPEGVCVDRFLHTTGPRVWACGDVTGEHQFSHMAEHEAKAVVTNLFLPFRQRVDLRLTPWTTFTDPEVASVGLTEERVRAKGMTCEVHRQPFSGDDRARVDGEGHGLVKILATKWGRILGAHIIGPRAGELIQEWVLAMRHDLNLRTIADEIHVYPTVSMANQRAAQRWYQARAANPAAKAALAVYRVARQSLPLAAGLGAAVALAAAGASALKSVSSKSTSASCEVNPEHHAEDREPGAE